MNQTWSVSSSCGLCSWCIWKCNLLFAWHRRDSLRPWRLSTLRAESDHNIGHLCQLCRPVQLPQGPWRATSQLAVGPTGGWSGPAVPTTQLPFCHEAWHGWSPLGWFQDLATGRYWKVLFNRGRRQRALMKDSLIFFFIQNWGACSGSLHKTTQC